MSFALERFRKNWIEQCVRSRFRLLILQQLLGVFLEINEICAHAQTVTGPSFPPPQRPRYGATLTASANVLGSHFSNRKQRQRQHIKSGGEGGGAWCS